MTKPKKQNRIWITPFIVILLITVVVVFKWDWFRAHYTHVTQYNFKSGDKLYAKPGLFDKGSNMSSLFVGRLIRPMNETDIDLMHISSQQKEKLKKQIDPSFKQYLISTNCYFDKSRLIENKSAYIGNFIAHTYLPFKFGDVSGEDSFYT